MKTSFPHGIGAAERFAEGFLTYDSLLSVPSRQRNDEQWRNTDFVSLTVAGLQRIYTVFPSKQK